MYQKSKRLFDVVVSAAALVLTAPLMLLVAAAVLWRQGRPIIFRQIRPGAGERLFPCYKFRTMTAERNENGELLSDQQRLTRLGHFLRRTSLDELPQLWNILRGDLSFIGPRPLLERYLPYYTQTERRRHSVRPGLTGWAQIHDRNLLAFDERLRLDVWYVDHMSWRLDLKILALTIWIVLTQRGYAADLIALDQLRSAALAATVTPNNAGTAGRQHD